MKALRSHTLRAALSSCATLSASRPLKSVLTGSAAAATLALAAGLLGASPAPTPASSGYANALALTAFHAASLNAGTANAGTANAASGPRRGSDGRYIYDRPRLQSGALVRPRAAAGTPLINEAVQTFDVFNPAPGFAATQGPSLAPTNLTPVWTADETTIVFSSNRTTTGTVAFDGRYHLWAIPVNGGTPIQLTSSAGPAGGGELFPALSGGNNQYLAFTSDAQSPGDGQTTPGTQNLFRIPFSPSTGAVNVSDTTANGPSSLTIRNDAFAQASGGTGFSQVGRPTFAGSPGEIVFSALTTGGSNAAYRNHFHLYFLFTSSNGSDPTAAPNTSLPGKLTDGPADDTDPAYSADAQYIAFASTAASIASITQQSSNRQDQSFTLTAQPGIKRNLFLLGGGGRSSSFGSPTLGGKPLTTTGNDNYGPAWSSLNRNAYLNPAPGAEYLAFSRGLSPQSAHDVYYLQVLYNVDSTGETGRSNEAATTPLAASTPIYRVNGGGPTVSDGTNTFTNDTTTPGVAAIGGTAETITPAATTNTTNDPTAPAAIYNTDRNGTFSYTFANLTPDAPYTVRVHFADPKNSAVGKRIFNVSVNGFLQAVTLPNQTQTSNIDIVQLAQSSPGRVDGVVTDTATQTPLPGATLTVTDSAGQPVATDPAAVTTTAATTPDPAGGAPINYNLSVAQGLYTVTASAPGYPSKSQTLNISSGAFLRADFALTQATGTVTGTVTTGGKPLASVPLTVTESGAGNVPGADVPVKAVTDAQGNYTLTLPVGSYYVTAAPPATSKFQVLTQQVTVAAATPVISNFALQSGLVVGTLGGLITNSVSTQPLGGVLVEVSSGANVIALVRTSATPSTPAAPDGDGKPVNYSVIVPVGPVTVQFVSTGYATQTQAVTVVNIPGAGTTAPNAFVRADAPLVSQTAVVGQNTAVVQDFRVQALSGSPRTVTVTDQNTGIITPSGTLRVSFAPVTNGGDPPIVQGIEILSGPTADQSSGLGANDQTNLQFNGNTPFIDSISGGNNAVNLSFFSFNGTPSYFNIYRSAQGSGQEGNLPYATSQSNSFYTDTAVQNGVEYYYQVTAVYNEALTPEDAGINPVVKLNTDDNATAALGGQYEDAYPTWAPGLSLFTIAYSSNRSITYNNPTTGRPSETAISVAAGGALGGGGTVVAGYAGILESQVLNLDPPTLVPYSGSEIVHIADQNGLQARANLTGGRPMSITVRLSSREAGIDDNNVYVQIKDPDSKYQDNPNNPLEHKVFTKDRAYQTQANNPNLNSPDSGSSSLLFNGGGSSGYNLFGNDIGGPRAQRGAIGGIDSTSGETIALGIIPTANLKSTNPITTGDDGKPLVDAKGNPNIPPGFAPKFYVPTGQEYECQTVNPAYATNAAGQGSDTTPSDYANPYYLAGVDDQRAFSGFPANGTLFGTVSASSTDATTGAVTNSPIGGATITVTDYFTGAPVTTTPSPLISSATQAGASRFTPNFVASLPPGQYRVTISLNGYGTDIETATINERGSNETNSLTNIILQPGTKTQDNTQTLRQTSVGNGHPPRPTDNSTTNVTAITPSGQPSTTPLFHPAEWLRLTRLPAAQQDGGGGTLYSVNWTPPASGSDFYLDVIAYDKAVFPNFAGGTSPFSGERSNWRIYDNVWGFSTLRDIGTNNILFVSDYTLGQKFAGTTFGGQNSLVNLVPKFYGAESYLTDIDVSLMPNATYLSRVITGRKQPIPEIIPLAGLEGFGGTGAASYGDAHQLNGLGVGSYGDANIDDGNTKDGVPAVSSQQYSIWRTLSRGPVPDALFQSYEPTTQNQPAVSDPGTTPATSFAAATVKVAPRCIVWSAPFAGDLLVGPGTITDPATQTSLRAFVNAGGRLFITGQDIGSALTQNGTTGNVAGSFLPDVLGATLVSGNQGTHNVTGGTDKANNRISNVAFFDGQTRMNFVQIDGNGNFPFRSPSQNPITVSNNIGGSIFGGILSQQSQTTLWRTDGSLDQLGPYATPFGVSNSGGQGNSVVSQIDTIAPAPGKTASHTDLVLSPFQNAYGTGSVGDPNAANSPGGNGLLYYEDNATGGTGAKVVYASFGFEGLSTDYYTQDLGNPAVRHFLPHNQRQNMLHNIVCYLRTGSITGTIRSTSGNGSPGAGIGGATVYLVSSNGTVIPGRGTFSALSDTTGSYRIDGVEPGTYTVVAYKNGFTRTTSNTTNTFTVEGDATQNASITLLPAAAGSLTGTVTNPGGTPAAGATVTFIPQGGGTAQIATTNVNGQYSLPTIPSGTYTGTATNAPASGPSVSQNVTITANVPSTVNFVLSAASATITGRVVTTAGVGVPGASVFFTGGAAAVPTVTTAADGTFTTPASAGSYTLTATKTGLGTATVTVQAAGGVTTVAPDLVLGAAANGTLGGLVLSTTGSAPLAGVTITITNAVTGLVVPATSTGTAIAAPDGGTLNYGPLTLAQGVYTAIASRGGVTTAPQTLTITTGTFTRQDFSGLTGLPAVHTFPAGLQFVSLPYNYASLGFDGVFGTLNTASTPGNRSHVALWDPISSSYVLDPTAPADAPRLGVGYWVFLKSTTAVTQTGATPTGIVSVALHPAWNQIGVPNTAGTPVSSLNFVGSDGVVRSFADASGASFHLISPTLYRYDGTVYQPVSPSDTLQPWTAYWIRVYTDVTLQIPTR